MRSRHADGRSERARRLADGRRERARRLTVAGETSRGSRESCMGSGEAWTGSHEACLSSAEVWTGCGETWTDSRKASIPADLIECRPRSIDDGASIEERG